MSRGLGIANPLTKINVKKQLLLLFLILVSPIFILHWYGNDKAEQILKRHVTEAYKELNKENHLLIRRDIQSLDRVTKTIIQYPLIQELKSSNSDPIEQRVRKYVKMEDLLTSYSQGTDGEAMVFSLYVHNETKDYSFAPDNYIWEGGVYFYTDDTMPEWMDEAIRRNGSGFLAVTDRDWPVNTKTLTYIRAVNSTAKAGDAIGALIVSNLDKVIGDSLQTVSLPYGEIYLTNNSNLILAATTGDIGSELEMRLEDKAKIKAGQTVDFISNGNLYVVNANVTLDQNLVYIIPIETLLQQQTELVKVIQLISIVYSLLAAIVMMYLWRSLITPLQKLASFVRTYKPGNIVPNTPGAGRKDEVGELITSVYDSTRRINDLVRYKYLMELKQKESQLQLLYQQINPHLLYNTLESIYWKSTLEGKSESAEMIKELSKLMKISLSRGRELITLEEELEHAMAYVSLQQMRYEYGFQMEWHISNKVMKNLIPKIALQPLIENAIFHGVKNMEEDGRITVSAYLQSETILITIEDNGYKDVDIAAIDRLLNEEESNPSHGYGIRNVHQRIRLHFGNKYGISYKRRSEGGTVVTFVLPIIEVGQ